MVQGYPRCGEAKPDDSKGLQYTTASGGNMELVHQLTIHKLQVNKIWLLLVTLLATSLWLKAAEEVVGMLRAIYV